MTPENASIERQLGSILARLDGIGELMRDRAAQSERQHDQNQKDLRDLRTSLVSTMSQIETDVIPKLSEMNKRLLKIEPPVEELMRMRSRLSGIVLVLGGLGGIAWITFQTAGRWIADHISWSAK